MTLRLPWIVVGRSALNVVIKQVKSVQDARLNGTAAGNHILLKLKITKKAEKLIVFTF